MAIRTYGPNAVDWEERIDLDRLRRDRLAKLRAKLEQSELGALLTFDFSNIRYMTATHIGTWAMDKLIRFAVLPRGGEPAPGGDPGGWTPHRVPGEHDRRHDRVPLHRARGAVALGRPPGTAPALEVLGRCGGQPPPRPPHPKAPPPTDFW